MTNKMIIFENIDMKNIKMILIWKFLVVVIKGMNSKKIYNRL
jgi:hypothetical protein